MILNRVGFGLIFIFFQFLFGTAGAQTESKTLKPSGFVKKIATVSTGKSRSYYALSNADAAMVTILGPGTLKVHTRAQFRPGDQNQARYTVIYSIDGGTQKSFSVSGIERARNAAYIDGTLGVPGELKTFEIVLSRGFLSVEFRLKDTTFNVAARYVFTPSKLKKQEWMPFSPLRPSEPVDLISRETTTPYYRFTTDKPLRIEIIGPTELRVLTRTEHHFRMKGRINYRVQVRENGNIINTYQLNSKISDVAVYKDINNLIPGTACEFVILIPEGKHLYEIYPLDQDKNSLLGRLLIPGKDVGLEE